MVVSFTPNIGLAKPDESELATNWLQGSQLEDDNNLLIVSKTTIPLTSYTPTLAGFSSAPSTGVGPVHGEYQDIQKWIFGTFMIEFTDPGVTSGGGELGFSLPFVADSTFHTVGTTLQQAPGGFSCIGEGYLYDASQITLSGTSAIDVVTVAGVSYARFITETFTTKNNRMFRDNMPFGFANGDRLVGNFVYKRV